MLRASDAFERDTFVIEVANINADMASAINASCKAVVDNKFPFSPGSAQDANLSDFGKLFGPGQAIDSFFKNRLAKYVDTSGRDWKVRADMPTQLRLNEASLRQFQRAATIRDVFFAQGGIVPSLQLSVTPPLIARPGAVAVLDHFGQRVETKAGQATAQPIMWPGLAASGAGKLAVTLTTTDTPAGLPPAAIERQGPWALFRLLATASPRGPNAVEWTGVVGGMELRYLVNFPTSQNPFRLEALREFRCPSGL